MRRTPTLLLAFLLVPLAAPAAPAQDAGAPVPPPPLRAALAACSTGPTEAERFAIVTGSMPALRGTVRMGIRFDLLVRSSPRAPWLRVRAKGFGQFERSDPGRAGFVYTKRVERLAQAAEYRAIVRFRWTQSDGTRREKVRRTPVCRQPDLRPDLRPAGFEAGPGPDPGTTRIRLAVVNAGRTGAGAFDVALTTPDGTQRRTVPGLPAGERTTVELVGGRCDPERPFALRIDAGRAVEESVERDNTVVWRCGQD